MDMIITDIDTVTDPVCGKNLDPSKVVLTSDYEGMRYYFCSEECKHRFDYNPRAYLESDLISTDFVD
jgi:YHS domain-containing protein